MCWTSFEAIDYCENMLCLDSHWSCPDSKHYFGILALGMEFLEYHRPDKHGVYMYKCYLRAGSLWESAMTIPLIPKYQRS